MSTATAREGTAHPDRRGSLLRSSRALFGANGFSATSMREIARHAGVSASLAYRHFPNKAELFVEAVFEPFLDLLGSMVEDFDQTDPGLDVEVTTEQLCRRLYQNMREERALFLAMIASPDAGPGAEASTTAKIADVFAQFETVHRIAIQTHHLRGLDPAVSVRIAFALPLAVAVFDDWLWPDAAQRPDEHEVLHTAAKMMSGGVSGGSNTDAGTVPPPESNPGGPGDRDGATAAEARQPGQIRAAGSVVPVILAAARDLFTTNGYAATSVNTIAVEGAVAESLIFRYFRTKDELFAASVIAPLAEVLKRLSDQTATAEMPIAALLAGIYDVAHANAGSIIAATVVDSGHEAGAELRRQLTRLLEHTDTTFESASRRHHWDLLDPRTASRVAFGLTLVTAVFDTWLQVGMNPPATRERFLDELLSYVISGATRR